MNNLIQTFIVSTLKIEIETKEQLNTFVGTLLVKLGMGGCVSWLKLIIYFFSYYYHKDPKIDIPLANSVMQAGILPILVVVMFSVKIAEYYSYKKQIRICCLVFPIGIICQGLSQSLNQFIISTLVLIMLPFGLMLLPLFNCLTSYFPQNIGKVIGMSLFLLGVSQFFFDLIAFYLINPNNEQATIVYNQNKNQDSSDGGQNIMLFEENIAKRVMYALIYLGIGSGICTVYGGFMVSNKFEENGEFEKDKQKQSKQQNQQDFLQYNDQNNSSDLKQDRYIINYLNNSQVIENNSYDQNNQNQDNTIELQEMNKSATTSHIQDSYNNKNRYLQSQKLIKNEKQQLQVRQAIFKEPFLIMSLIALITSIYLIALAANFKTYLLGKINDDRYLTYTLSICNLLSSFSNILWGILIDKYILKYLYIIISVNFTIFSILFPFSSGSKICMPIVYLMLHICHQGIVTLAMPSLIQFFGQKLGSQLVPYKLVPVIIGVLILPLISYYITKTGNYDETFVFLGVMNSLTIMAATQLKEKYNYL